MPEHEPSAPAEMPLISSAGDLPAPPGPLPIPQIPGYNVIRVIGEGGMSAVYEAWQEKPHRRIALKVLLPTLISPALLRRFSLEIEILGRLEHPAIARIYEAGSVGSGTLAQPFFAMEFIEGLSITDYVERNKLSVRRRLELLRQVVDGVHHAHQKGIIHRDIKPSNILMGADGQPKILDFGVARLVEADVQVTTARQEAGVVIGTLPYMSPEQADGRTDDVDIRTDVYALGILIFEVLTGQRPYRLETRLIHEAVRLIHEQEPTRLGEINRAFRGDLELIVRKAIEKDKDQRYASAAALSDDLHRYLTNLPITAQPPSVWYLARKFTQRHKALAGSGVAIFLALATGLVLASAGMLRARRAEEKARKAEHEAFQQSDKAHANLRKALNSVDQFTIFVSEGPLARLPEAAPVREQLLRNAVTFYEELAGENPQDDQVQLALNWALIRMGCFYYDTERWAQSRDLFNKNIDLLNRLIATNPQSLEYQHALATSLAYQGAVLRKLGAATSSLEAFQQALTIRSTLADQHPDRLEYQKVLAMTFSDLGRSLSDLGQMSSSRWAFAQGKLLARKLVDLNPGNYGYKYALARIAEAEGRALLASADYTAAEFALNESYSAYKALLLDPLASRNLRVDFAHMLGRWALMSNSQIRLARLQEANTIWTDLARNSPEDIEIRRAMSWVTRQLSDQLDNTKPAPLPPHDPISEKSARVPRRKDPIPAAGETAQLATAQPGVHVAPADALDTDRLLNSDGLYTVVQGRVSAIGQFADAVLYFNKEGIGPYFQCVIHKNALPSFKRVFGVNLESLWDQDVIVNGILYIRKGIPTMGLDRPDQIQVVSAAGKEQDVVSMLATNILRSRIGEQVIVEGYVDSIGETAPSDRTFINFGKSAPNFVTGVIQKEYLGAMTNALGGNLSAVLVGRKIQMRGRLVLFRDRLQIEIYGPGQIKLIESNLPVVPVLAQDELRTYDGDMVMVEGRIDVVYTTQSGAITFLNCGSSRPYLFTAVIRNENLGNITAALKGHPADVLIGRPVRISGLLYYTNRSPSIEIRYPSQIEVLR